jgi:hypothetical protein
VVMGVADRALRLEHLLSPPGQPREIAGHGSSFPVPNATPEA